MNKDCTLEDYLNLYATAVSVFDLDSVVLALNKEYKAYLTKTTGNPIKVCSYKSSFGSIPYDLAMFKFYEQAPLFWMIPLETPDHSIQGFIIRDFNSKLYRTVVFTRYPLFFGMHNFKDFEYNDTVILVEGTRDCLYMQSFMYPYTLSLNTAKVFKEQQFIISCITKDVVYLPDMDDAGRKQVPDVVEGFKDYGVMCHSFTYSLKDLGEYFYTSNFFISQLRSQVKKYI